MPTTPSVTLSVGHTDTITIQQLDQNGNPMLAPVTPDTPPVWTNTALTVETIAPAASGLSAVATPIAPGADVISVTLTVGGVTFTASLDETVTAAPQALTSIVLVPNVN
jgi:hypothetical protein